jgi:hypothetical protein
MKLKKKLSLARETIRLLDAQLGKVGGGYRTQYTCDDSCLSTPNSNCDCSMTFICNTRPVDGC